MLPVVAPTLSDIQHLYAVRYLAFSGLSILVYDTLLTFSEELRRVWFVEHVKHQRIVQLAYFVTRYGNWMFASFYLTRVILPVENMSNESCFRSAAFVLFVDVVAFACGNGLVLYQLIRLWNCGKSFGWLMALGFILTNAVTIVCSILTVISVKADDGVVFTAVEGIRTCDVLVNPKFIVGCYIPGVVLELYSFSLLILNAISRPRAATQKLVSLLYKDGLVFFMVTLSTRLLNLVLNIKAPTSLAVLGISFGASLYSVSIARLHLRMSALISAPDMDSLYDYEGLIEAHELQDCAKGDVIPLKSAKQFN